MIDKRYKPKTLQALIRFHMHRHAFMHFEDIYKLLYQDTFGPQHLLKDEGNALKALQAEWQTLDLAKEEPLCEPLSASSPFVRLNLRPYKKLKNPLQQLWDMLQKSAATETTVSFEQQLDKIYALAQSNKIALNSREWLCFCKKQKTLNYPVLHHSQAYRQHSRPAYRVILTTLLPEE